MYFERAGIPFLNEDEIEAINYAVNHLQRFMRRTLDKNRRGISLVRCQTPPVIAKGELSEHGNGVRAETTKGTYAFIRKAYPQITRKENYEMEAKNLLPLCVWQSGYSFRNEDRDALSIEQCRFIAFQQCEFQLVCMHDTMQNWHEIFACAFARKFGGEVLEMKERIPPYSLGTFDCMHNGVEIASCSRRKDFECGDVFELAVGLERFMKFVLQVDFSKNI